MPLGGGQLRQLSTPALAPIHAHLDRAEIRIGEIAVIAGAFLAPHALGELLALIPEACFLHHRLTGFVGLDLALDLVFASLLNRGEGVHVLDLHLRAEGRIRPAAHGDVHVATQGALLHVAVAHAEVTHDPADLGGIFGRLTAGAQIRLAHNLGEGHAGAVVIHQRMGGTSQTICAGVHKLARVFLHVQTLDSDAFEVGVFPFLRHLHFDPAVFGDRLVVLGDLVVLRQIGVEILLAIKLAVLGDVEVERHRRLHCILEHPLIEHRQRARQPTHHGVNVGVGVVAEGRGGTGEDLAVGAQLHVGLQADHGFPGGLSCHVSSPCVGRSYGRAPVAIGRAGLKH